MIDSAGCRTYGGAMSSTERVALFGGSFHPVHRGHLFIAKKAVEACGLDRVMFVPCWKSPHKAGEEISDSEDRVAMLELATDGVGWGEVSGWEVAREQASYSWKTAQHFAEELGEGVELFWIVGTDQWEVIESWAQPDVLAELVTFVVFPRGGVAEEKEGFRMVAVDASFDASSTETRRRVRAGEGVSELVVPAVERLIRERGLYL
jgi:nicotinate-nucleotide adenylyltransferase